MLTDHVMRHQLREIELRVQREINEKRQELLAKEESLRLVSNYRYRTFFLMPIRFTGTWRAVSRHKVPSRNSETNHRFHQRIAGENIWDALYPYSVGQIVFDFSPSSSTCHRHGLIPRIIYE